MGQAIGSSLPLAVGVALSPVPIIAVVLMLTSRRARSNGQAFVIGWLIGLAVVGAIVLSVAGPGRREQIRVPRHLGQLGQNRAGRGAVAGRGAAVPGPPEGQ